MHNVHKTWFSRRIVKVKQTTSITISHEYRKLTLEFYDFYWVKYIVFTHVLKEAIFIQPLVNKIESAGYCKTSILIQLTFFVLRVKVRCCFIYTELKGIKRYFNPYSRTCDTSESERERGAVLVHGYRHRYVTCCTH